jgi:hypothetical protein
MAADTGWAGRGSTERIGSRWRRKTVGLGREGFRLSATVILVEGGWSTAVVYDGLIAELDARGVDAVASGLVNPGTGAEDGAGFASVQRSAVRPD